MVQRNLKNHNPDFKDVADNITIEQGMTLSGVCTLSAANVFSGQNTFSEANTFSGPNTFSAPQTFNAATTFTSATFNTGHQSSANSVTSSLDGGIVTTGVRVANITSTANHFRILLPVAVVGTEVILLKDTSISTCGYSIRTHDPAACSINAGSGTNAESAISSTTPMVRCYAISTGAWIAEQYQSNGNITSVTPAA